MKILQDDGILIQKICICQSGMVHEAVAWISRLRLEIWKHRQSAEKNPQDGYNRPATTQHVRCIAVEDLMLSQEDKPKGTDQLLRLRVKLPFSVQACTG